MNLHLQYMSIKPSTRFAVKKELCGDVDDMFQFKTTEPRYVFTSCDGSKLSPVRGAPVPSHVYHSLAILQYHIKWAFCGEAGAKM